MTKTVLTQKRGGLQLAVNELLARKKVSSVLKILTVSAHLHNINGQGLQTGCLNWVADDSSVFVSCD